MSGYSVELKIYPVTIHLERPKTDYECGGKVLLPQTILDALATNDRFFNTGPMLFLISLNDRFTHCGVLEFTANEGCINAPSWIFDILQAKVGDLVKITSVKLPKAKFVRFQPQSADFLDITNPKAVLENHLREFACLTEGDLLPIFYNNRVYYLRVEEAKPFSAVCINECDMEVDFSPIKGFVDNSQPTTKRETNDVGGSSSFSGVGHRLDGKVSKEPQFNANFEAKDKIGQPDFQHKIGTLEFIRKNTDDRNRPNSSG